MRAILLILIWLSLAIIGLSRLSFNVEITSLLPDNLPEAEGIRHLYEHFSRENELMITLAAEDPDAAESAASSLAKRFSENPDLARAAIWRLPFEDDPKLGAELLAWLWFNGPTEDLAALAENVAPGHSESLLAEMLENLASGFLDESTIIRSYDPLGFTELPGNPKKNAGVDDTLFASADGTFRVIYLEKPENADFSSYREVAAWIAKVRAEIAAWRSKEGFSETDIAIGLTGEPAFVAEISTAMERDMKGSVTATTLLIALLFWLWHRRFQPLLWLILMLGLIFSATFAIGGMIFGQLTAMSLGFAAILLGLAVDYGVVLFRERYLAPGDPAKLRRIMIPSIGWAALTTAAVFASLNLSSLPGVAELGTLVAIGTVIGAAVMVGLFARVAAQDAKAHPSAPLSSKEPVFTARRAPLVFTGITLIAVATTLATSGFPHLNRDSKPFQLRNSEAFAAIEQVEKRLSPQDGENSAGAPPPLPLIVVANSWEQLAGRLDSAEERLQHALESNTITDFVLPSSLVPHPEAQARNRSIISHLISQRERLKTEIIDAGFREEATALTDGIMNSWSDFLQPSEQSWILPESDLARWLLQRAVSGKEGGQFAAVGRVESVSMETDTQGKLPWADDIDGDGIQITGWETVDPALNALVAGDFPRVFFPMGLILVMMLALVFRNVRDLCLSLSTLAFSGLSLMTLSQWFPSISWNTFNLAALPILFGTGLDYSIHMIFALRRSGGKLAPVRQGISQALLFCGLSTGIGFGSLAFASSEGLASLGLVCALGILLNMLSAIWLLPHWWRWWRHGKQKRIAA